MSWHLLQLLRPTTATIIARAKETSHAIEEVTLSAALSLKPLRWARVTSDRTGER